MAKHRLQNINGHFVESDYENALISYLEAEQWSYVYGDSIPRTNRKEVLYLDDLLQYLEKTYSELDDDELRRNFLKDYNLTEEDYDENLYYDWYDEEMARIRCSGLRWIRARYSIDDQVSMEELPDYTEDIQVAFLP